MNRYLSLAILFLFTISRISCSHCHDDVINFNIRIPHQHDIYFDNTIDKDICVIKQAPRDKSYHAIEFKTIGDDHEYLFVLWGIPLEKDISEYLNTTTYPNGVVDNCYHHPLTHAGARSDYVTVARKGLRKITLPDQYGYPLGNFSNIGYFVLEVTLRSPQPNITVHSNAGISLKLTSNLRPKHAGMFITGIETSFIHLPPLHPNVVLHNYLPNHAPYGVFSPTQSLDKVFNEMTNGNPIRLLFGLGDTNSLGKEVSSWIWRNGTVPVWVNVTHILATQNISNPFGNGPQLPIGEPELIEYTSMTNLRNRWTPLDKVIYPGDAYSVECVWNTMSKKMGIEGNFMEHGEMCNYVMYYTSDYIDPSKSTSIVGVDIFYHFMLEGHSMNPFTQEHGHH